MTLVSTVAAGWIGIASVMAVLWLVQRSRGNAGIVDVAWSFGTGTLGMWFAWSADGYIVRRAVVMAMVGVWGFRLGGHLLRRVSREAEDGRYQQLRREWGNRRQRRLFVFFQYQALWAVLFAAPKLAAAANPQSPLTWFDVTGIAIGMVAVAGEAIADHQLARFRANPTNRSDVCRAGLWRYSRHPNYFFEWLHWWAYIFLAVGSPLWWIPPAGALAMLWFLMKVTGIPLAEAQALRTRGEAYREYQRATSAFFPWPPAGRGGAYLR